jgi:hypothetical protein
MRELQELVQEMARRDDHLERLLTRETTHG